MLPLKLVSYCLETKSQDCRCLIMSEIKINNQILHNICSSIIHQINSRRDTSPTHHLLNKKQHISHSRHTQTQFKITLAIFIKVTPKSLNNIKWLIILKEDRNFQSEWSKFLMMTKSKVLKVLGIILARGVKITSQLNDRILQARITLQQKNSLWIASQAEFRIIFQLALQTRERI